MKRSGQQRPFRTIGARMRDFGRSMMRTYIPPQELPAFDEPPAPSWSAAAQTPLVWPEPPAPGEYAGEMPPDSGFEDAPGDVQATQDFAPPPPRRPQNPQQPPVPPSVQRKPGQQPPQPQKPSVDQRLKNILAMHQAREAERDQIREEKKSAFNAAEIQRQTDPNAPHRPRRGRMSVDYVETSALSHGEEPMPPRTPPSEPVQREVDPATPPPADEPQSMGEDTAQLDPSEIQSALDAISLQRELSGQAPTFEADDYIPAGDEDAQAFFDSPPDWSEDSGDMGTPPPVDPPPTPMPPQGSAQRMPGAPESDDVSGQGDGGNWGTNTETEYPYESPAEDSPSDVINLPPSNVQRVQRQQGEQRSYQPPAEPDFGGAADFDPSQPYDDVVEDSQDAEYFSPPSDTVQRDFQPTADFGGDSSDAHYDLPTFDMDEGETRPLNVQRAPILPPLPDFADDLIDVPPAETGYSSLADWMDAQADSYGDTNDIQNAPDSPVSPGTVQRETPSNTMPIAPDFSLQTGDYNRADYEWSTSAYLDAEDESDTRPIDVQRAFSEPEFWGRADEQATDAAYPVDEDIDYFDYGDQPAPRGDVYTPPDSDVNQPPIQRAYDQRDTQTYDEPADVDAAGYDQQNVPWSGEVSTPPAEAVQREYELPLSGESDPADTLRFDAQPDPDFAENIDFGYENAPPTGDVDTSYTPPADVHGSVQRETFEADDAQSYAENAYVNEDVYEQPPDAPASEGQWGAQGAELYAPPPDVNQPPIQREYDAAPDAYLPYDEQPPAPPNEAGWSGDPRDAYVPPTTDTVQREYDAAPDAYLPYDEQPPASPDAAGWSGDPREANAPPTDTVQLGYEQPPADAYTDDDMAVYDETAYGFDAQPSEGQPSGDVYAPPPDINPPTIQRDYDAQAAPPVDESDYADDADESAPGYGYDAGQPSDQAPYDSPWTGDNAQPSSPTDAVQRDYYPPTSAPDTDDTSGQQPMDLYQAMMGAGMVTPDSGASDTAWGGVSADSIQRTPDAGADAYSSGQQPVDLYQAMMQTGMIESEPDDPYTGSYYPPEPDTSMSAATKADLLSLLDTPAPHSSRAPETGFTPDVSQPSSPQNTVSRSYQPPQNPPVIQRAETTDTQEPEQGAGQGGDVDVDQLARDVYNALRNRLRIERERRDRKP